MSVKTFLHIAEMMQLIMQITMELVTVQVKLATMHKSGGMVIIQIISLTKTMVVTVRILFLNVCMLVVSA